MEKQIKNDIKEILKKDELTRYEAKVLLIHLYQNSFYVLGNEINMSAYWLKEMITAIKVFTLDAQQRILQNAREKIKPSKKIKERSTRL